MAGRGGDRGSATVAVVIIVVVLLAVGGLLVGVARWMAADAQESRSWPTTDATIVLSEVEIVRVSGRSDTYDPLVVYTYSVDGESFTGERIAFGAHNSGNRDGVERTVARYPVGSVVPVAYDPTDPGRSVLEPGNEGVAGIVEWVGYGFIAGGVITVAIGTAVRRRGRRSVPSQAWG